MNYKTKHKQNTIFPVNYPKNHPETTTMNEASNRPPKSSTFKLNFPKMKMPKPHRLKQTIVLATGFIGRYSSLGGLIFLTLLKMAIKLIAKILSPLLILINKSLNIIIGKFDEMSEDFYRFMEYFFLMDEEALIPIAVEANGSNVVKRRISRLSLSDSFKSFRFKIPHVSVNAARNKLSDTVISDPDLNPGPGNKKRFASIKRTLPFNEKFLTTLLKTSNKMKLRFLLFHKTIPKLPLKTIELRFTRLKTLFKFPFTPTWISQNQTGF